MARFKVLSGDVNYMEYGGKWYRKIKPGCYHIIETFNWEDMVGEREAAEVGYTYNAQLSVVDLNEISPKDIGTAMDGWNLDRDAFSDAQWELVQAEACHSYGNKAPIWDADGNNWRKLMKATRDESRALDEPEYYEKMMGRPVNAICMTAHSYMVGNFPTYIKGNNATE